MPGPEGSPSFSIGLRTLVAILILFGGLVVAAMKYGNQSNSTISNSSNSSIILLATPLPHGEESARPSPSPSPIPSPTPVTFIVVYVSGSVRNPDTYQMRTGTRVKDAIVAAGGMTEQADASRVNLAEYLYDAQHIHIPALGEPTISPNSSNPSRPASPSGGSGPGGPGSTNPININRANQSQLEQLDGIGTVLAGRIIAYRETNGPFATVEELQNVQGISPALVETIRNSITVGP